MGSTTDAIASDIPLEPSDLAPAAAAPRVTAGAAARALRGARNPIRLVLGIGCLSIVALAALTAFIILELRQREIASAQRQLAAFDILLAEQTARSIQGVDLVVNEVADELQIGGVVTAADFDALRGNPQIYQRLRQRVSNIPQLDAITLDSAAGKLIDFSRYLPVPDVDISDRAYFKAIRDDPTRSTIISEPVRNRGDGLWDIYLAHRITGPHGAFIGVVLGAIRVDYFESLYETVGTTGGISIGLWRQDGMLLARYPRVENAMGRHFPAKARLATMVPGDTTITIDDSDVDGVPRMIASHLLPRDSIVVDVSQTEREVLADWRHEAIVIGLSGVVCILAACLLVWALVRQFTAYEGMATAVAGREEAVRGRQLAEERLLLAQKMEAIGRITSGVAHDFNNLLTSIIANAELLTRGSGGDKATAHRRAGTILQAADRGAALVRQLLAFSRQQVLAPARVDVAGLLSGMTELLESALGAGLHVRLEIDPDLWPAMIDPVQFEHMVLNLAINARDAQAGAGEVVIAAENFPAGSPDRPHDLDDGDYVLVAVIDYGTGMSEEVLRNVFEPFFTTKPLGRGSGLGLSQVYGVARQSGGSVRIRSTLGAGTTVQVFLPWAAAPMAAAVVPARLVEMAGRVVLLADDDPSVRETVAASLTESGFAVEEAPDGKTVLARLEAGLVPDVLLLDARMPGLDGPTTAARARARLPGLAVVFMTGDAEAVAGERWVIQKPFLAQQIVETLQAALS